MEYATFLARPRKLCNPVRQNKAEAYQRVEAILENGPFVVGTRAVHRAHFLYSLRWPQVGARITEMNGLGWTITSITLPEREWRDGIRTAYRLDGKPLSSARESQDWYVSKFGARPSTTTPRPDLPLFAGVR